MNLVLTICHGDMFKRFSEYTHPTIKAYANKISADFKVISEQKISESIIHWEKFQIFDLLNDYERILFVDTDVLIREDCPNIFDIVPTDKLGMFNEAPWTNRSQELMIDCCKIYDVKLPDWNGKYYNSGVMVVSRRHKYLFRKPELEYSSFCEQTYLNMKIAQEKIEMFELDYKYNRMPCMDVLGEERFASYVIHYAGCPNQAQVLQLLPADIRKWEMDKDNGYKYQRHILIQVNGGLGDQICAEPAIRFMKERVYQKEDITIVSHWPRVFQHLGLKVYDYENFQSGNDIPYYSIRSLPDPTTVTYMIVSNLMCHTVDYCAIALLKRTLPFLNKTIQLEVDQKDLDYVKSIIKEPLEDLVLVHPGKHWESKTLPKEYWQELIDKLALKYKVCVIGKDYDIRGAQNIVCPANVIDTRNLLDLGCLFALISKAKMLVSSDSGPIHIAGAFDNWIVVIPTCKHTDHILPFRNGVTTYKTRALCKKLVIDDCNSQPTCMGSSAEFIVDKWSDYLLEVDKMIEEIDKIYA